jgi:transcription initiation factor TFIIIB Brf1 subunit/transcription initiation factor TFIIB
VSKKDIENITIGFHDYKDGSSVVGTCHLLVKNKEIDISKQWWDFHPSTLERQELIFHELGHCVLGRSHTEAPTSSSGFVSWVEKFLFKLGIFKEKNKLPDGCPSSFMHPYTLRENCVSKHYLYYLDELFTSISYEKFEKENSHKTHMMISCKMPEIINNTKTWTEKDIQTLERAKKTCVSRYKSCLKRFTKVEDQVYRALCY